MISVILVPEPGELLTDSEAMQAMAGHDWSPLDRSIDVHISNLRRKIDTDPARPSLIRKVRGLGYMCLPPE